MYRYIHTYIYIHISDVGTAVFASTCHPTCRTVLGAAKLRLPTHRRLGKEGVFGILENKVILEKKSDP